MLNRLAILSLVSLPFLNPVWTSGCSQFTYCWSLVWRILSISLLVCEMSAITWWFEHFLMLPFLGIGMKTDLFQSCGHCWVFQICWHIECNTFTASYFRIWNSSAGIPSLPLGLFTVTWLQTPGCLTLNEWSHHHDYLGCEDHFCIVLCILATSSSYLLLLLGLYHFCLYSTHLCKKCFPGISNFLKEVCLSLL